MLKFDRKLSIVVIIIVIIIIIIIIITRSRQCKTGRDAIIGILTIYFVFRHIKGS